MIDRQRLTSIAGRALGNVIEWFDFLSYAILATYFAKVFFSHDNMTVQLLNTAAIAALDYIIIQLGSWLIGILADRSGRRLAPSLSVAMMSGGSMIIALTAIYATIGIAARAVLVFARLLQGFSMGGEAGKLASSITARPTPDMPRPVPVIQAVCQACLPQRRAIPCHAAGRRMIRPECRHIDRQRPIQRFPCRKPVAHVAQHPGQVVGIPPDARMFRSQRLLVDRQRPLERRVRRIQLTQVVQDHPEMVDIRGHFRMLCPQRLGMQRQRTLHLRLRVGKLAQLMRQPPQIAKVGREISMIGPQHPLTRFDQLFQDRMLGAQFR
jgi:hypothetical protein